MWIVEQGGCQGIFHAIGEEDLERILRHPATMIASDGEVPTFGKASPAPAQLRHVRARARRLRAGSKVITLEDAVRKMTAFPAQRLGLVDRGLLRPGMKADIAVFDPARVRDMATFEKPHQYAEGISHGHRQRSGRVRRRRDDRGRPCLRAGRCTLGGAPAAAHTANGDDVDPQLPALRRADPRERRRLSALRRRAAGAARTAARSVSRAGAGLPDRRCRPGRAGEIAARRRRDRVHGARGDCLQDLFGGGRLSRLQFGGRPGRVRRAKRRRAACARAPAGPGQRAKNRVRLRTPDPRSRRKTVHDEERSSPAVRVTLASLRSGRIGLALRWPSCRMLTARADGSGVGIEYQVVATNKTSTMEKELNEAAEAGFRFDAVMGGETAFGGKEVVVVMSRAAGTKAGRFGYRLLATSKTSTMQKEMQDASDAGFQYRGQTVFNSAFGGDEVVCILERDSAAAKDRVDYRLVATSKTSTLQKELRAGRRRRLPDRRHDRRQDGARRQRARGHHAAGARAVTRYNRGVSTGRRPHVQERRSCPVAGAARCPVRRASHRLRSSTCRSSQCVTSWFSSTSRGRRRNRSSQVTEAFRALRRRRFPASPRSRTA